MPERQLCVVAHQDDDLLFLNPDTAQAIRRGAPVRVVFVTAGEFNGNGVTREAYAEQRRQGVCCACAEIAGVADNWSRQAGQVAGRDVELDVLVDMPTVELMFLGLPDGGDSSQANALTRMWADPSVTAYSLVYPNSPARTSCTYARADLLSALVSIMRATTPTVIRVQDTDPDPFLRPDHADHIAVATFTSAALDSYVAAGGSPAQLVENRCYNIENSGLNLLTSVIADKTAAFDAYLPYDTGTGTDPNQYWVERAYYRWGSGTSWAGKDGAGTVHAFCVRGGSVWHWRQVGPGGPWQPPVDIGGGPISSNLVVAANADGRVEVFGVAKAGHDIVTSYQLGVNGPYSPWVSLGNPNGPGGRYTGAPFVGANADGRLQVFAKNSGGGISTTYQTAPNAGFSAWTDFGGGPDIQETPAAVLRPTGTMMLFASTRTGVQWWPQQAPNAGWPGPTPLANETVTSAPSAALNADGRPEFFYRTTSGAVHTIYRTLQGTWSSPPTALGGDGVGPVSALLAQGRIFLLARNALGGVSATWQQGPNVGFGPWVGLDPSGLATGTPTMVTQPDGWPLAIMTGTDGVLRTSAAVGSPSIGFGPWQAIT
jgi:LmbE family N-acetylglucosaminyl deacetylase